MKIIWSLKFFIYLFIFVIKKGIGDSPKNFLPLSITLLEIKS